MGNHKGWMKPLIPLNCYALEHTMSFLVYEHHLHQDARLFPRYQCHPISRSWFLLIPQKLLSLETDQSSLIYITLTYSPNCPQSPMYRAFVHVRADGLTLTFTLTSTLTFGASLTTHLSFASHRSALISHLLPLTTYPRIYKGNDRHYPSLSYTQGYGMCMVCVWYVYGSKQAKARLKPLWLLSFTPPCNHRPRP